MSQKTELTELAADLREQVLYLQELGVESLKVWLPEITAMPEARSQTSPTQTVAAAISSGFVVQQPKASPSRPPGSRLADLPSLSKFSKGGPVRTSGPGGPEVPAVPSAVPNMSEQAIQIQNIRDEIGPDCRRCPLHSLGRSKVVNSVGNFDADLMFVGEAPGADEDAKGEPFVGRAGQLLTDIIEKGMGLKREDVFIGNINRCRPPENRAPTPEESAVCKPFLFREIEVVKPRVIVVLGATAAQNLLETKVPIGKLRGQFHDYRGTKVMPTFHPAYLLRDPHKKREVWEDMKMVMSYLGSK